MNVEPAPDVKRIVDDVLRKLPFPYVDPRRVVCIRSTGATSRARARIWSFPKVWQVALAMKPYYVIEVLSQHFDHLPQDHKIRVVIHELMHIPKNFSGALVPHRGIHKKINARTVEVLFSQYSGARDV